MFLLLQQRLQQLYSIMDKKIIIKLTKAGPMAGPFDIYSEKEKSILKDVPKKQLIRGLGIIVDVNTKTITLQSKGKCSIMKTFSLDSFTVYEYISAKFSQPHTGSMWRHLTNTQIYNTFYGSIEPYIIEYPKKYRAHDEILQNVKDYTKVFKYLDSKEGVFTYNNRIELDNRWFNKAVIYNNQQSSGLLEFVPKVKNNLSAYNTYPIYNENSKTIVYTKSDNYYQYNTFWAIQKDVTQPFFVSSCEALSIDRLVNHSNMDYKSKAFNKATIRAKDVKIRHILDNSSDIHLVSQFLITSSQISIK